MAKQQVVVIGGGNVFPSYAEYLSQLKRVDAENVDFFRKKKDWKEGLQEALGPEYDVFLPQMPNKDNAQYREWEIRFGQMIPFLDKGPILIGHSLGGAFLAKYQNT